MRAATDYIVVHCSATPASMDIGALEIDGWHKDRGWSGIGYHFVIRRTGVIELGRDINVAGAHAKGYNGRSVAVCLVGGIDKMGQSVANFTDSQYAALDDLVATLARIYPLATTVGHRDLDPQKDCPCFDVQKYFTRPEDA